MYLPHIVPTKTSLGRTLLPASNARRGQEKGRGVRAPTLLRRSVLAFLLSSRSLREGLRAGSRLRGSYGFLAATFAYVVSLRFELKRSLLIVNLASVGYLLTNRASIDVVALVAEAERRRSLAARDPGLTKPLADL